MATVKTEYKEAYCSGVMKHHSTPHDFVMCSQKSALQPVGGPKSVLKRTAPDSVPPPRLPVCDEDFVATSYASADHGTHRIEPSWQVPNADQNPWIIAMFWFVNSDKIMDVPTALPSYFLLRPRHLFTFTKRVARGLLGSSVSKRICKLEMQQVHLFLSSSRACLESSRVWVFRILTSTEGTATQKRDHLGRSEDACGRYSDMAKPAAVSDRRI